MKCVISTILAGLFLVPVFAFAQTATSTLDEGYVARAVVLRVLSHIPTGDATTTPQSYNDIVTARIVSGIERGKFVEFSTYYTDGDGQQLKPNEAIYVSRWLQQDQSNDLITVYSYYSLDHDRMPVVILFSLLFLGCIVWLGGRQGIRGLISLTGGICFIVFILLPGVIHGYSPLLMSIVVASFVATIGAYVTHGFSRMTTSAIIGMVITIIVATLLAQFAVYFGHLSGITDENSYYLLTNPNSYGSAPINFQGLLLGGIIIGLLGVLYDAAIGQSVAVEELNRIGSHLPRKVIYDRAVRIGREHIGALVNTLVLAYVGASLPVMITVLQSSMSGHGYMAPVTNWEFVATEIIRTTIGATGLILTIPITTWIAVLMLVSRERQEAHAVTVRHEIEALENAGHLHSHHHDEATPVPFRSYGFSLGSLKTYIKWPLFKNIRK